MTDSKPKIETTIPDSLTAGGAIRKGSGIINDRPAAEIIIPSKGELPNQGNPQENQ